MKRIILFLLLLGISVTALAGCGESTKFGYIETTPSSSTTNSPTSTSSQETSESATKTQTNTPTQETSETAKETEPTPSESATVLATGECGDNITWVWDDSQTLTLSGEGDMINYTDGGDNPYSNVPWYEFKGAIETLIVGDGITSLGDYSFYFCESLSKFILPDSLSHIGKYAFWRCNSLVSVVIPDTVTSIGESAFRMCDGITSVVIGDGLTDIPDNAFSGYSNNNIRYTRNIREVTIGKNVKTISSTAFAICRELQKITFTGDAVESLSGIDHSSDCVLYYPKDNPTWIDSGVFATWDGKVEGY